MAIVGRIPQTNIRLKHLIKVYSLRSDGPIPLIRTAADITANPRVISIINSLGDTENANSPTKLIGTIQTMSIESERDNNFYRVLNFDTLGKIQEVYPGLPEFTGSVKNVALFNKHLVDSFQASTTDYFSGEGTNSDPIAPCFNIYNQISPLLVKVDVLAPGSVAGGLYDGDVTKSVILWDFWLTTSNLKFSVDSVSDLAITQESDFKFAWPIVQGA
jgi:hypothetical protein